jgi:hypothetical protein
MLLEDESSTVDLKPVHRRPCPTLRPGQEETRKCTHMFFFLICQAHRFTKRTMNINKQLQILQLEPFIGRPHSGIDVGLLRLPLGLP